MSTPDLSKFRTIIEQFERDARDAEAAAVAFRNLADENQRLAYSMGNRITTTVNAAIIRWPELSERFEAIEQDVRTTTRVRAVRG